MQYLSREDGQGLIEYAFLLVLVAFLLIALVTIMGQQVLETYEFIKAELAAI